MPAHSLDTPAYLRALWALCEMSGGGVARWRSSRIESLSAVQAAAATEGRPPYDAIIVTSGACAPHIAELKGLPLRPCRGQNLLLRNSAGLRIPIICGKYIVPVAGGEG